MKNEPVMVGQINHSLADGTQVFADLKFHIQPGKNAIIGPDRNSVTLLCKLMAKELEPSDGVIATPLATQMYFAALDTIESNQTVADELGYGRAVRAVRQIRNGSTDSSLFEIHAENWDAEDRCYNGLNSFGLQNIDLLQSLSELDPNDLVRVRLASLQLNTPELIIWDSPSENLNRESMKLLMEFLTSATGTIILGCNDVEVLKRVDHIWKLTPSGLKHYSGSYESYLQAQQDEFKAAAEELVRAEHELEHRLKETGQAHAKRLVRRARNQRFSDPCLPRKHRGNMKRKSQESLAKAKANDEHKVEIAESKLERARELLEELQETAPQDLIQ